VDFRSVLQERDSGKRRQKVSQAAVSDPDTSLHK